MTYEFISLYNDLLIIFSNLYLSVMRRAKIRAALFALFFLIFLLLMDYPYLSRIYNDLIAGDVIASYQKGEENSDCEIRLRWAEAYNRYLAGEDDAPEGVNTAEDALSSWTGAASILCVGDSDEAGWIRIEALDLMLPLFVGTSDEALRTGAGILEKCSLPVGGESTHACISAHRGLPDRTLFTNLDLLKAGDQILLHTLNRTCVYEVTGSETVLPHETEHLSIRPKEDLLTLITCTPYGINTHRLYVHARRSQDDPTLDKIKDPMQRGFMDPLFWKLWWWVPASIFLIMFMLILVKRYLRRYR